VVAWDQGTIMVGFFLLLVGAAWLLGRNARTARALGEALEELAASAERAREEEAQRGAADERARLAREVHDVVAHSLSVIVVQAGAARRVAAESPDEARIALSSIEQTGREALGEIRRLLGVLRSGADGEGRRPQPSLVHLGALLEPFRRSGLQVEAQIEGALDGLPVTIDVSGFRIVQEALTNCLRYARGARARVSVVRDDRDLQVEVLDDGPVGDLASPVSGHGLAGMRERATIYGGQFEAGPRPEGGWRVWARFPLGPGA
jgi:signal transduction histidine kinase